MVLKRQSIMISFRILCRNLIEDYYVSPEYCAIPFHDFTRILKNSGFDPVVWYKNNLYKQFGVVTFSSFTARRLKRVLKEKISLQTELLNSTFVGLYIEYQGNLYEICNDNVNLLKYCNKELKPWTISTVLVLDDQPEGEAYSEGSLHFYFHSKEQGRHHKPHVHVKYGPGLEVVMDLITGDVLQGEFPSSRLLTKARRIITDKRALFIEWWNTKTDGLNVDINYALGITHLHKE